MVTHRRAIAALLAVPLAFIAACDKVPLLAPTGSVISLFPQTTSVSLNSRVTIVATVIENGVAAAGSGTTTTTRAASGTPVQNGTVVTFTTTLGRIEPSEARTHNGEVTVTLITDSASGTATITAFSGGASTSTTLKVGTAAAKTVTVTAVPQSLGANGGSVQVIATVTDDGGNPVGGVPVTFSTDKGAVSPSTVSTDANGNAAATLTTSGTSKVTATAGTVSGTTTVNVSVRGLSGFQATPSATTAGTPVSFSVTPTTGANLSNVHVDYGDGDSQNLGSISVVTTVSHAYGASGTYTATATATDAGGDAGSLSTTVIVGSLQVTLSASSSNPLVNTPVTFTAGGLGSAVIHHFGWTLDDGTGPFTTAGPQFTHSFTSRGAKTVRVDVFDVNGRQIGTATTSVDVQ
jgi:Bacterial Ig-like domain (group 1)/PKD domain